MILSFWDSIENVFNDFSRLVENNSSNPIFWIILLLVLVGITYFGISNLGNK